MKLRRREVLLLSLLAVAALVALWPRINRPGATPAVLSRSSPYRLRRFVLRSRERKRIWCA